MTHIISEDELPHSGSAHRFEGYLHGGANVSFFLSDTPPGGGPGLHTHPYEEVFVMQEGDLTFTVGMMPPSKPPAGRSSSPRQACPTSSSTPAPDEPGTSTSTPAGAWSPSGSRRISLVAEIVQQV